VLKRYYDWIMYRTKWFMDRKEQREGPEFALIGNDKILWTTADKSKKFERQQMMGVSMWVNRLRFDKPKNSGLFITGTIKDGIDAYECKTMTECKDMYLKWSNKGLTNVPFILIQGQRRVWASLS